MWRVKVAPKIALGCRDGAMGLTELIPGGLRWVIDVPTQSEGITPVVVKFADLRPTVRAKPVGLPLRFDAGGITRIQLLHSSSVMQALSIVPAPSGC